MKVVINACYGGFSLSPEAVEFIAKKKGQPCHFYVHDGESVKMEDEKYKKTTAEEAKDAFLWNASTIESEEEYNEFHSFKWREASIEERQKHDEEYENTHHDNRPSERHDEALVEAVETLGSKKSSGSCAQLKVIEIPITVYNIEEYDGYESVSEPHRTWS